MPKIKIIIVDGYYDYDDHWCNRMAEGISDWEEVSDEDYQYIRNNLHHIKLKVGTPIIIQQDDVTVAERIKGIKKTIKKYEDEYNQRIAESKRKAEERAAAKAAKKLERDRKALERLVIENPDLIKDLVAPKE